MFMSAFYSIRSSHRIVYTGCFSILNTDSQLITLLLKGWVLNLKSCKSDHMTLFVLFSTSDDF